MTMWYQSKIFFADFGLHCMKKPSFENKKPMTKSLPPFEGIRNRNWTLASEDSHVGHTAIWTVRITCIFYQIHTGPRTLLSVSVYKISSLQRHCFERKFSQNVDQSVFEK